MNRNILHFTLISLFLILTSNTVLAQKGTIHVTDFTVNATAKKVVIDWKTDGATATNYFAIQKSADGVNYKTVALVMGPDPKQKSCDCYGCSDKYTAKAYYRLVHVDADGNESVEASKLLASL